MNLDTLNILGAAANAIIGAVNLLIAWRNACDVDQLTELANELHRSGMTAPAAPALQRWPRCELCQTFAPISSEQLRSHRCAKAACPFRLGVHDLRRAVAIASP